MGNIRKFSFVFPNWPKPNYELIKISLVQIQSILPPKIHIRPLITAITKSRSSPFCHLNFFPRSSSR